MVTEVIMKRDLFGMEISQKSKSEFFSATDLVFAGNTWRSINRLPPFDIRAYWKRKSTEEFIAELEAKYGEVKKSAKGRGQHTWVHPFLFIDIALEISPTLKIEVYQWLFDSLIALRNDSGDSYKKMTGCLYQQCENKSQFPKLIADICHKIQHECNVLDWQKATEEQLSKRNKIHEYYTIISDFVRDPDECLRLAFLKAK